MIRTTSSISLSRCPLIAAALLMALAGARIALAQRDENRDSPRRTERLERPIRLAS